MFTIKFYSDDGCRQLILSADSFTILRGGHQTHQPNDGEAEITLHRKGQLDDQRIDIKSELVGEAAVGYVPPRFQKAIIENAAGRTTEIIALSPGRPAMISANTRGSIAVGADGKVHDYR